MIFNDIEHEVNIFLLLIATLTNICMGLDKAILKNPKVCPDW